MVKPTVDLTFRAGTESLKLCSGLFLKIYYVTIQVVYTLYHKFEPNSEAA